MYLLSGGRVPAGHHRLPTQRLQGELGSAGLGWGWSCLLGADREGWFVWNLCQELVL